MWIQRVTSPRCSTCFQGMSKAYRELVCSGKEVGRSLVAGTLADSYRNAGNRTWANWDNMPSKILPSFPSLL